MVTRLSIVVSQFVPLIVSFGSIEEGTGVVLWVDWLYLGLPVVLTQNLKLDHPNEC